METNGIRNSPFQVGSGLDSAACTLGPAEGQENSLAGGRNCNRPYGSRDAQGESVFESTQSGRNPGMGIPGPDRCAGTQFPVWQQADLGLERPSPGSMSALAR